tara:strand:- start:46 stop:585 length:540 start_codon:yes stop_codon:yes gene_type:complete
MKLMFDLKDYIKSYPDFPKKGILFRDMFPLLQDPVATSAMMSNFRDFIEELQKKNLKPDYIVGIESRGFLIGGALAAKEIIGFVPIRKKGKLPGDVVGINYSLEYGEDRLEIATDVLKDKKVLLVDDLLATGGTVKASVDLIRQVGGQLVGCAFIIELTELNGRKHIADIPTISLINYD